jgi:hypothetical protein
LIVTEGAGAMLTLTTMRILTSDEPAVVMRGGSAHRINAMRFVFNFPPAIVLEAPIPHIDIGWTTFSALATTSNSAHTLYAIANDGGAWGEDSQLVENVIHTLTCEDEKLGLTPHDQEPNYNPNLVVLHTVYTCGTDNRLDDPCVFGQLSKTTGFCDCEEGCTGDLCTDKSPSTKEQVWVCYDTRNNDRDDTYVPLPLEAPEVETLLYHPGLGTRNHKLRDACMGSGNNGLSKATCAEFAPTQEFTCNCGFAPLTNYSVSSSEVHAGFQDFARYILRARDGEVADKQQEVDAYEFGYFWVIIFLPGITMMYLLYQSVQNDEKAAFQKLMHTLELERIKDRQR